MASLAGGAQLLLRPCAASRGACPIRIGCFLHSRRSPFSTLADLRRGFCGFCKSVLSLALREARVRSRTLQHLLGQLAQTADRHAGWWPSGGLNNASALKNVLSPSGTHTSASSRIASRNATFPSLRRYFLRIITARLGVRWGARSL